MKIKLVVAIICLVIANYALAGDIEFTPVKGALSSGTEANDWGLFVKFNGLTMNSTPANAAGTDTKIRLTMFGSSYTYNGKDIAFNAYASGGYTAETKDSANVIINGGSSYVIDGGVDLNYIIMNDKIFLSTGLAGLGYISGVFIDSTTLKQGDVGVINTLGLNSRVAFYPLSELYFTGQIALGFISLYSASLTGKGLPSYSLSVVDAEKPFQFLINGKVYWRPSPKFAIGTGLGFNSTTYTDSASKTKYAFSNFYPYICMDFLF